MRYNGTASIDVSSGDQVRDRLSRSGNRRINHALHMMAVTQIRYPGTDGRRYYERKRTVWGSGTRLSVLTWASMQLARTR